MSKTEDELDKMMHDIGWTNLDTKIKQAIKAYTEKQVLIAQQKLFEYYMSGNKSYQDKEIGNE